MELKPHQLQKDMGLRKNVSNAPVVYSRIGLRVCHLIFAREEKFQETRVGFFKGSQHGSAAEQLHTWKNQP